VVVALPLTDALLGCPPAVLSGRRDLFCGVDSHADTLHVAVISDNGGHLADAEFATTTGYAAALAFVTAHGHVIAIGVEGTSSYGAAVTRATRSHGHQVVEVNRPDRAERVASGSPSPSTPTPPPAGAR
jgi:hypothetical protein